MAINYYAPLDNFRALTITDGGPLTMSGLITQSAGSGTLAVNQNVGTAPTLATSGTITTAGLVESRVTTAGAVTGVILQPGTISGQICFAVNTSANTITFAAAGTSNVANGVTSVIAANSKIIFVWDSVTALWY
jgi:hypothetical protein